MLLFSSGNGSPQMRIMHNIRAEFFAASSISAKAHSNNASSLLTPFIMAVKFQAQFKATVY